MNAFEQLLGGFANALSIENLGWSLLGVTLGTFIGILPGIFPRPWPERLRGDAKE